MINLFQKLLMQGRLFPLKLLIRKNSDVWAPGSCLNRSGISSICSKMLIPNTRLNLKPTYETIELSTAKASSRSLLCCLLTSHSSAMHSLNTGHGWQMLLDICRVGAPDRRHRLKVLADFVESEYGSLVGNGADSGQLHLSERWLACFPLAR